MLNKRNSKIWTKKFVEQLQTENFTFNKTIRMSNGDSISCNNYFCYEILTYVPEKKRNLHEKYPHENQTDRVYLEKVKGRAATWPAGCITDD